jgi:maltose alpha-D-glucosyltransferase/alpha-amylase
MQADWYKDSIIYQLHVKAFQDADNDGTGDFAGLISRLEYVKDLGCNAVWLLPFYPSPLRDDGYDIADYRRINPIYGSMGDFRRLVRAAHKLDMRVITELVINHTSDQHRWFQNARRAKPGSAARDYYVWSDTDQKYLDTRIIFLDTEISNWTWDPEAQAYFWHRFYSHQPDLNFDNPKVFKEIVSVLHHWMRLGVDGMRLDAVPYLCEREGTNNENLPETHDVLRRIRAEVDAHFPGRMLLAEANQWPEDTRPYFGDGDECHAAFHFPLMPRMYMALAQEDRHPVTDIIRQTPEIPAHCQWAIFLRNHDELTLEMVTDKERDYLWEIYAKDRRMRINLGIRRRLAPLLDNNRSKIELMNALLLSMPGTPVLYYGDELGMGDNIFLGDRDGVRTPMQWTPDRNGGFSRADPQRLYLPPIMDPVYGYEAVNVEAQQTDSSSLLNWTKRLLRVRSRHAVFGRGTMTFLYPRNRKILAYLREHDGQCVLCVANLSRSAQAVELDLSAFRGRVPVELLGRSAFPPVGDLPYLLTLQAYGFFWFLLAEGAELPDWHEPIPEPMPEFATLVIRRGWQDLIEQPARSLLDKDVLPSYLPNQRWFAAKQTRRIEARLVSTPILETQGGAGVLLAEIEVDADGMRQRYFLPLSHAWDESYTTFGSPYLSHSLARIRHGPRLGALFDATTTPEFAETVLAALREDRVIAIEDGGRIEFSGTETLRSAEIDTANAVRLGGEQSNTSLVVDHAVLLKLYRRLEAGVQPEIEMSRHLTMNAGFDRAPAYLGHYERHDRDGGVTAYGVALVAIANQGDGWSNTLEWLERLGETASIETEMVVDDRLAELLAPNLTLVEQLARRTAQLHTALARPSEDAAFSPEPVRDDDMSALAERIIEQKREALTALRAALPRLDDDSAHRARAIVDADEAVDRLVRAAAASAPAMVKTRIHGDYHLGQVLLTEQDFFIIDFEGEPMRSIEERRSKQIALKDVAGMLRSFDYAAHVASAKARDTSLGGNAVNAIAAWNLSAQSAFWKVYAETAEDGPSWPGKDASERVLPLFLVEKVLYEIGYEAANRPDWLAIPMQGLARLLGLEDKE